MSTRLRAIAAGWWVEWVAFAAWALSWIAVAR